MGAGHYDLEIEQGSALQLTIVWKDNNGDVIDLTDYTAIMQIRETKSSTTTIAEYSTDNGKITIIGESGQINIDETSANTADYDFISAVYDLKIIDTSNNAYRLLEGTVVLNTQVTR